MHKWDSDDDDEGADIQSSGSRSETYGDQSFEFQLKISNKKKHEQTGFEGYGMNTDEDLERHTGTFSKLEVN